jgi:hypothetical protein
MDTHTQSITTHKFTIGGLKARKLHFIPSSLQAPWKHTTAQLESGGVSTRQLGSSWEHQHYQILRCPPYSKILHADLIQVSQSTPSE